MSARTTPGLAERLFAAEPAPLACRLTGRRHSASLPSAQRIEHTAEAHRHHCNQRPDRTQHAGGRGIAEHAEGDGHQARNDERDEQCESHASLPAAGCTGDANTRDTLTERGSSPNAGLHAFIHGTHRPESRRLDKAPPPELAADTAAHITAWADADTDLGHLDGCYCGCPAAPRRAPVPAEACTELGAGTAEAAPSLVRRAHIRFFERRFTVVADERHRYEAAGVIGAVYHRNSMQQQLLLMERIRALKEGAPIKRTLSTALIAIAGAANLLLAGCGGGCLNCNEEQPEPRPPVDCAKTPELCK